MKSATVTSTPVFVNGSNDLDLAPYGLSISFTLNGPGYALVNVGMGISSASDFEYRPEIRLGGATVYTHYEGASASTSGRSFYRGCSYVIPLVNGVNVISAGVLLGRRFSLWYEWRLTVVIFQLLSLDI